jgi:hypothetical protein
MLDEKWTSSWMLKSKYDDNDKKRCYKGESAHSNIRCI